MPVVLVSPSFALEDLVPFSALVALGLPVVLGAALAVP